MKEITYSKKESDRFNKRFYRLKTDTLQVSDLKKQILDKGVDILMLRLPSLNINNHHQLSNMGFPYLHADTLVDYKTNIRELEINATQNEIRLIQVDENNKHKLENIIPIIFDGYKNHYFSNPNLEPRKINAGYVEWALSYVNQKNKISWLVKKDGEIVGFANCSFDGEHKDCRCVLYGVLPDYTGQGIYSDMIRETQKFFKKKGYVNMWASTQAQNYTSQKVWLREGFFLNDSFETYHINAMLSYSDKDDKNFNFIITEDDLHKIARNTGIESRLTQEAIFKSYLSKYFEMAFPGAGSTLIDSTNLFLVPIDLNKEYKTRVTTMDQRGTESTKVLATVFDQEDNRCLLSYNTLLKQS